jgi:hypothetical protein
LAWSWRARPTQTLNEVLAGIQAEQEVKAVTGSPDGPEETAGELIEQG